MELERLEIGAFGCHDGDGSGGNRATEWQRGGIESGLICEV